jgi:hypothetical protein
MRISTSHLGFASRDCGHCLYTFAVTRETLPQKPTHRYGWAFSQELNAGASLLLVARWKRVHNRFEVGRRSTLSDRCCPATCTSGGSGSAVAGQHRQSQLRPPRHLHPRQLLLRLQDARHHRDPILAGSAPVARLDRVQLEPRLRINRRDGGVRAPDPLEPQVRTVQVRDRCAVREHARPGPTPSGCPNPPGRRQRADREQQETGS